MFSKINYDLRSEDGGVLFLPPSPDIDVAQLGEPDVYAESAKRLFPIGTLLWYPGMGKKYRYSKAGDDLSGLKQLVVNGNRPPTAASYANVNGFYDGDSIATWAIGATEFTFIDTVDKVKDAFAGAHLLHFDKERGVCFEDGYIISGPPEAVTAGGNITVQFHKPRKYAKLSLDGIEIWLNPYSNIVNHDYTGMPRYSTCMGVPPLKVTSGRYFWLQTAGPVFITPNTWGVLCPGYDVDTRVAMVVNTGGIICASTAGDASDQRIGVLLSATEKDSADAWVDMDLDLGH